MAPHEVTTTWDLAFASDGIREVSGGKVGSGTFTVHNSARDCNSSGQFALGVIQADDTGSRRHGRQQFSGFFSTAAGGSFSPGPALALSSKGTRHPRGP